MWTPCPKRIVKEKAAKGNQKRKRNRGGRESVKKEKLAGTFRNQTAYCRQSGRGTTKKVRSKHKGDKKLKNGEKSIGKSLFLPLRTRNVEI